ncbi:FecR family protein [Chitinophaga lutea]
MANERLQYLLDRYFSETYTDAEKRELAAFVDASGDDALHEALETAWERYQPVEPMPGAASERVRSAVFRSRRRPLLRRLYWSAAAVVLLAASAAAFLYRPGNKKMIAETVASRFRNEVPAGGNKAILTLPDGSIIALDSAAEGLLAQQGQKVRKTGQGELKFEGKGETLPADALNTVRTPRGGEFRLTLPDGTRVWLNAASSVTFPASFSGGARRVSITGEVYFEVAKMADMPFRVAAGDMTVEVLGTHFNINAYPGEPAVRTTLLEGAVRVESAAGGNTLKPGQQASLRGGHMEVNDGVDIDEVMAWKNGLFQFNEADMAAVMRKIANWYDVEVHYEGEVPVRSFGGAIQRSLPLTKVLRILEENNVRFRVEGKTITVLK